VKKSSRVEQQEFLSSSKNEPRIADARGSLLVLGNLRGFPDYPKEFPSSFGQGKSSMPPGSILYTAILQNPRGARRNFVATKRHEKRWSYFLRVLCLFAAKTSVN